ncbi:Acyl-CoA thioesterase I precursor [Stieleria maiorica]|uniref:Acyl-CoA thioesterase I n=1 Tax=Stieleria maiorica TaxID=2795974 RepID=A0A5B9MK19_9BACT|nr:GDSL-type esterase/lipase family protein [Stieleria maiorica]QEG01713.1 Acyl-CoA thioesterase I precursor [Stieleria maiorica]
MPDDAISQATTGVFRRIFRTLGICLVIVASLLCFPHWLPWMIAAWILWHTLAVMKGSPGYWPLFACTLILAIRLVPRTPAMMLLAVAMVAIAVWRFRSRSRPEITLRYRWLSPVMLAILWGLMFVEYRRSATCNHEVGYDPERPIVCIGDSLTQGMIPDPGYPGQLATMVRPTVINLGASGIATGPAIGILERAMVHRPQAVIIELGGHDFLKFHSRASTKANLVKMITLCRTNDCEPILMEIPRGFMIDPYASLERELAYEFDLQLVDDRWLRHIVLMSPAAPPGMWFKDAQLSDDGIHSNPRGSGVIATFVADALVEVYGDQVLRSRK